MTLNVANYCASEQPHGRVLLASKTLGSRKRLGKVARLMLESPGGKMHGACGASKICLAQAHPGTLLLHIVNFCFYYLILPEATEIPPLVSQLYKSNVQRLSRGLAGLSRASLRKPLKFSWEKDGPGGSPRRGTRACVPVQGLRHLLPGDKRACRAAGTPGCPPP